MGGGADSIENYFSKIWEGWRPSPQLAGGKPHGLQHHYFIILLIMGYQQILYASYCYLLIYSKLRP